MKPRPQPLLQTTEPTGLEQTTAMASIDALKKRFSASIVGARPAMESVVREFALLIQATEPAPAASMLSERWVC